MINMFSENKQTLISERFLDHFGLAGSTADTMVWHPQTTKPGFLHIDIYELKTDSEYYLYSIGGSGRKNHNGKYCEVFFRFKDNLPEALTKRITSERASLHSAIGFEDETELMFLDDGEYNYFDDADELWLSEIGNGEFCGLFIYEAFRITSGSPYVTYYKAIPASKAELDFIENHKDVSYKDLILAFKPYLGDRMDLTKCRSLTEDEMQRIYEELITTE